MTERQGSAGEETQTERVSGQPVDSKAELWKPGETGQVDEPERGPDERRVEPRSDDVESGDKSDASERG